MNNPGVMLVMAFLLALTGCQDQQVENNRRRAAEVMEIHDQAMAKMGFMHELKLKLQEQVDTGGDREAVEEAILALESAHREMMVWMRQYREPTGEDELREAKSYLEDQRRRITRVSMDIDAGIARARSLLD